MAAMLQHAHAELRGAEYVIFADVSRRYLDCTEAVCTLLGHTRDEILRMTVDDVSYNIDEVPGLFAQYLKTGAMEGDYVLRRKDATPVPIRYRAFVFSDGCNAAVWEPIQDWREPYLAALLEIDPTKLKRKLDVALAALDRARASQDRNSQTVAERQAMADALSALNSLRRNGKQGP
jgi:PAS domain-containing protein